MKSAKIHAMTIDRISRTQWMVSGGIDLGDGQHIKLSLSLPAQPDHTVAHIEQELIGQAVKLLQQKLQD